MLTPLPASSRLDRAASVARLLAAYLIVPNVLFLGLSRFVFVTRPLVNLDYLLLGAVAGLLPVGVNIAAYAVLIAIDAFVTLAPVFHFGLETAVFSVPYGLALRWGVVALVVVCAVSVSTVATDRGEL